MKASSFFPQDTRSTEFVSAFALMIFSLVCVNSSFFSLDISTLIKLHSLEFWVLLTGILGGLQFFALALYPRAEILRIILSWTNGSFWVWMSLNSSAVHIDPSTFSSFFLGLVNLYAFCINAMLLRKTWEN